MNVNHNLFGILQPTKRFCLLVKRWACNRLTKWRGVISVTSVHLCPFGGDGRSSRHHLSFCQLCYASCSFTFPSSMHWFKWVSYLNFVTLLFMLLSGWIFIWFLIFPALIWYPGAPITLNITLSFCPYNGKTCCNATGDSQLQKQFQAMNISDSGCSSLLKSILCAVSQCPSNNLKLIYLWCCQILNLVLISFTYWNNSAIEADYIIS